MAHQLGHDTGPRSRKRQVTEKAPVGQFGCGRVDGGPHRRRQLIEPGDGYHDDITSDHLDRRAEPSLHGRELDQGQQRHDGRLVDITQEGQGHMPLIASRPANAGSNRPGNLADPVER